MGLFTFFDRFRGSGSSNASGGDRSPWGDFSFESVSARTSSGMRVSPDSALRLPPCKQQPDGFFEVRRQLGYVHEQQRIFMDRKLRLAS